MKTIGLIGGMSFESTITYYQVINKIINEKLGGFHSSKCILYSVDFQEIEKYQSANDWGKSSDLLTDIAKKLELAGADFIVICTNTMHKVADEVSSAVNIPLLHIAEATAQELLANNIKKVALLGTIYTMEQDFYKSKLISNNIDVIVPDKEDRLKVNHIIYKELCLGIISKTSKEYMLKLFDKLKNLGAEGIILGCTEIGLLVKQDDCKMPLFDTTLIHAKKAALYAI